jgi:hypothetical protein
LRKLADGEKRAESSRLITLSPPSLAQLVAQRNADA